ALQLGLRRESTLDALVAALAPHVQHSPEQIRSLLGPTPVTRDKDLVQLARALDRLEKETDRGPPTPRTPRPTPPRSPAGPGPPDRRARRPVPTSAPACRAWPRRSTGAPW